jgi:hypothetical protein
LLDFFRVFRVFRGSPHATNFITHEEST